MLTPTTDHGYEVRTVSLELEPSKQQLKPRWHGLRPSNCRSTNIQLY